MQIASHWYVASGTYVDVLMASNTCDSTIISHVSKVLIDTSVVLSNATLVASSGYATYEWIDCSSNLPIPGASGNTFIAPASGNYAVVIHDASGCSEQSACVQILFTSLQNPDLYPGFELYPNPASDLTQLTVPSDSRELKAELVDLSGKILNFFSLDIPVTSISLDAFPSGIYYLKIYQGNEMLVAKMLAVIK